MFPSPYRLPPKIPRARHETLVEKVLLLVGWSALMTMLYLVLDPRHSPEYSPVRADLVAPAPRAKAADLEGEAAPDVVRTVWYPGDLRSISAGAPSRAPRRGPGSTGSCR